jgi:hypothetical protein
VNNSSKIPVSSTDIREAFYKLADGLHAIISATGSDSATSGDKELSQALDGLMLAFRKFAAALLKYNWD